MAMRTRLSVYTGLYTYWTMSFTPGGMVEIGGGGGVQNEMECVSSSFFFRFLKVSLPTLTLVTVYTIQACYKPEIIKNNTFLLAYKYFNNCVVIFSSFTTEISFCCARFVPSPTLEGYHILIAQKFSYRLIIERCWSFVGKYLTSYSSLKCVTHLHER